MTDFHRHLIGGAAGMGIAITDAQAAQFEKYHELLLAANEKMNLTRVPATLEEAIDRNYLDSISPLSKPFPEGVTTLADIGSGAGFPGIPLSILLPEVHVVLIDALGKRVKFLEDVIEALGLNAEARHLRAEDAAKRSELREQFDLVTARAVAPLNLLCEYLLPFARVGGTVLALKGPTAQEELSEAEYAISLLGGTFERTEEINIPGRDWQHQLVFIQKTAATPEKYPRKAGLPEKRPLISVKL